MGAHTHIQWTDHTFNPWEGCTKVSPGCAHCYAEARDIRFTGGKHWGKGAPRRRTSVHNWNDPRRWNKAAEERSQLFGNIPWARAAMDASTHRPRVFCASLADWLDDEVPIEWLADLLDLIRETPNLDWQLLTKRPENWRPRMEQVCEIDGDSLAWSWLRGNLPANVWIGTTVEDQQRADERIPLLLEIPAKVRFLSCEPLLEDIWVQCFMRGILPDGPVEWVICGGESGKGARPMHPDWARSLRDQCAEAGVPFFFKQWGEWLPQGQLMDAQHTSHALRTLHDFGAGVQSVNVGKIAAGRQLDGIEHNAFPA